MIISRMPTMLTKSLPSREARIEILDVRYHKLALTRRFPRGKRGLKSGLRGLLRVCAIVASLAGSED